MLYTLKQNQVTSFIWFTTLYYFHCKNKYYTLLQKTKTLKAYVTIEQ